MSGPGLRWVFRQVLQRGGRDRCPYVQNLADEVVMVDTDIETW